MTEARNHSQKSFTNLRRIYLTAIFQKPIIHIYETFMSYAYTKNNENNSFIDGNNYHLEHWNNYKRSRIK
jgi:hypothetical protein